MGPLHTPTAGLPATLNLKTNVQTRPMARAPSSSSNPPTTLSPLNSARGSLRTAYGRSPRQCCTPPAVGDSDGGSTIAAAPSGARRAEPPSPSFRRGAWAAGSPPRPHALSAGVARTRDTTCGDRSGILLVSPPREPPSTELPPFRAPAASAFAWAARSIRSTVPPRAHRRNQVCSVGGAGPDRVSPPGPRSEGPPRRTRRGCPVRGEIAIGLADAPVVQDRARACGAPAGPGGAPEGVVVPVPP